MRRRRISLLTTCLAAVLTAALTAVLTAGLARAGDISTRIQKQYESLKSFQASFVQELTNAASKETRTRQGTIAFRAPGLVRWETQAPDPELIVVGDGPVWNYFADEGTAYKYPRQEILGGKTMLRFLSGQTRLDQDFHVTESPEADKNLIHLEMVPKEPEPGLVRAEAWVTDELAMLTRVRLVDFFGNVNDVRLENLILNPDLPDSLFEFTPPKGTEIQDNTK